MTETEWTTEVPLLFHSDEVAQHFLGLDADPDNDPEAGASLVLGAAYLALPLLIGRAQSANISRAERRSQTEQDLAYMLTQVCQIGMVVALNRLREQMSAA